MDVTADGHSERDAAPLQVTAFNLDLTEEEKLLRGHERWFVEYWKSMLSKSTITPIKIVFDPKSDCVINLYGVIMADISFLNAEIWVFFCKKHRENFSTELFSCE